MPFTKLGLSHSMLEGVRAMGYVEPTPIQLRAIPMIMAGQDVIGQDSRLCSSHSFPT